MLFWLPRTPLFFLSTNCGHYHCLKRSLLNWALNPIKCFDWPNQYDFLDILHCSLILVTIIFLSYFWHMLSGVWNKTIASNMGDFQYIIRRDYFQKIWLWKLWIKLEFLLIRNSEKVRLCSSIYLSFFLGIYTFQDVISASNPSKILWSNLLWNRNRMFIPLRYSQWKKIFLTTL